MQLRILSPRVKPKADVSFQELSCATTAQSFIRAWVRALVAFEQRVDARPDPLTKRHKIRVHLGHPVHLQQTSL